MQDVDNPLPQPKSATGEKYGRAQMQPRGLDHFKNKFGFTVNPGEINVDNIKIWEVTEN